MDIPLWTLSGTSRQVFFRTTRLSKWPHLELTPFSTRSYMLHSIDDHIPSLSMAPLESMRSCQRDLRRRICGVFSIDDLLVCDIFACTSLPEGDPVPYIPLSAFLLTAIQVRSLESSFYGKSGWRSAWESKENVFAIRGASHAHSTSINLSIGSVIELAMQIPIIRGI